MLLEQHNVFKGQQSGLLCVQAPLDQGLDYLSTDKLPVLYIDGKSHYTVLMDNKVSINT